MTDAKISLGKVESELYRAYTKSDGGVIAKAGDGIRTTVGSDAFSPYINSAYIKNAVGRLPSLQVASQWRWTTTGRTETSTASSLARCSGCSLELRLKPSSRSPCNESTSGSGRGLSPGVYRTLSRPGGAAIMKLYHFVSRAEYKKRLGFEESSRTEALRIFPGIMIAAIERAIRTAR